MYLQWWKRVGKRGREGTKRCLGVGAVEKRNRRKMREKPKEEEIRDRGRIGEDRKEGSLAP
jgi:hypothetical protein